MKYFAYTTSIVLPLLLLATPAHAASFSFSASFGQSVGSCGSGTLCDLAGAIIYLINYVAVPVLFAVAFIVFIYGVFKAYILSGGDSDAVKEGHQLILWGIIGFVVMISLWGLVNLVSNTLGLGGESVPRLPRSY